MEQVSRFRGHFGGFYAENVTNLREHMKEEMDKGKTSWKRRQRESGWDGT